MKINKTAKINAFVKNTKKLFLGLIIFFIVGTTFVNVSVAKNEKKHELHKDKNAIDYEHIKTYFTSFDLKKDNAGYTLQSVGKSQDWLEGRLSARRYKPFVGSYIDVETANQVIKEIVLENETNIKEWLDKDVDKFISLHKKFDKKIGVAVENSENKYQDCNIGVVVLRKLYNQKKFFIVESYPVSNDMQKIDEGINNSRNIKEYLGRKERAKMKK